MRGIRVSHNSPHINHLFFVDDALLFIRNKNNDVVIVRDILQKFENMLGQKVNLSKSIKVNLSKSTLFFSLILLVIRDTVLAIFLG